MIASSIVLAEPGAIDAADRFAMYCEIRTEELGLEAWPDQQRLPLLRMQYEAQRRGYRAEFPAAVDRIILHDGAAAGWVIVDDSGAALRCLDIAVRTPLRGHGLGSGVLRALQQDAAAAGRAVTLSVERSNLRALALYVRLGFRETAATDTHVFMEWRQS